MANPFDIREPLEKDFHGKTLVINPLHGRDALTASYRFSKYLSPSIGAVMKGMDEGDRKRSKKASLLDIDLSKVDFAGAVNAFFINCSEKDFESFCSMMFKKCKIEGIEIDINSNFFIGRPELQFALLTECVRYQFGGFFSAFKGKIPGL